MAHTISIYLYWFKFVNLSRSFKLNDFWTWKIICDQHEILSTTAEHLHLKYYPQSCVFFFAAVAKSHSQASGLNCGWTCRCFLRRNSRITLIFFFQCLCRLKISNHPFNIRLWYEFASCNFVCLLLNVVCLDAARFCQFCALLLALVQLALELGIIWENSIQCDLNWMGFDNMMQLSEIWGDWTRIPRSLCCNVPCDGNIKKNYLFWHNTDVSENFSWVIFSFCIWILSLCVAFSCSSCSFRSSKSAIVLPFSQFAPKWTKTWTWALVNRLGKFFEARRETGKPKWSQTFQELAQCYGASINREQNFNILMRTQLLIAVCVFFRRKVFSDDQVLDRACEFLAGRAYRPD